MKTIRQRLEALEQDLNTEPVILTMPGGRIISIPRGTDYLRRLMWIAVRSETASREDLAQLDLLGECIHCQEPGGSLFAELICAVLHEPAELLISAFANPETAEQVLSGKGHSEITYDEWLGRAQSGLNQGALKMMQLMAIDGDAVIRIVDGTHVSRVLMGKTDPTYFRAANHNCEILELYVTRLPRPLQPDQGNPLLVDVYLRCQPLPNVTDALAITREVQRRLNHTEVRVSIRSDSWFIEDARFPLWFPFEKDRKLPTRQEYQAGGEVFCWWEAGLNCRR